MHTFPRELCCINTCGAFCFLFSMDNWEGLQLRIIQYTATKKKESVLTVSWINSGPMFLYLKFFEKSEFLRGEKRGASHREVVCA